MVSAALALPAYASSVIPQMMLVDRQNAGDLGVSVHVFSDALECPGLLEIYVAIPRRHRKSELRSVMLKAEQDDQAVLETPIRVIDFEDYRGFSEFHGVTVCVKERRFERLKLTISYGRGEVTLSRLQLSVMEFINGDEGIE